MSIFNAGFRSCKSDGRSLSGRRSLAEGRRHHDPAARLGGCVTLAFAVCVLVFFFSSLTRGRLSLVPTLSYALGGLYQVQEIKPHVFVWLPDDVIEEEGDPQSPRAGNAGFILGVHGVAVIDSTNSPFHAREILYEIRERTEQPVKYLIDTNPAPDLILGNEVFRDLEATIVSTAAAKASIAAQEKTMSDREVGDWKLQRRMRGIHISPPEQTFSGAMRLPLAGEDVRLVNLDTGPESGDAVVEMPARKVVFMGDAFENGYFPRLGARDIRRWIASLRQAESWDMDVYVPGHGAPGGKKELAAFRQFLEWLANEVQTRIEEKKSLEQIKQELVPFPNYPWHAPELAPGLVQAIYEQLQTPGASASITVTTPR